MKRNVFLSILSGALLAMSFPPMPLFLMAFIALIPILFIFSNQEHVKHRYLLIYITFFVYHAGTNWWISSWQEQTDPYLMISGFALAIVHPVFFMIPFAIFFYLKKKLGKLRSLIVFPFIWVAFEWAHSLGEFSYPWLTIGNTQIYNRFWVQFIDITGVWGASLLIALVNVLVLSLILIYKENNLTRFKELLRIKPCKRMLIAIILIFLIPHIYGAYIFYKFNHQKALANNEKIVVGVIQPNINPWEKWSGGAINQIRMHQSIQDSLELAIGGLDLAIWSETAIPPISLNFNSYFKFPILSNHVEKNNTSLLTGFAQTVLYKSKQEASVTARKLSDDSTYYQSFNSAILLNPNSDTVQVYQKMRLTPFAERIPYVEVISFAQKWLEWGVGISNWGIGLWQHNVEVKNKDIDFELGSIICIESIYPSFCRNFAKEGAGMLSVITNDAWYDFTIGPEQHYQISAIRAIENRRYIARCANTGVSGFLSPLGTSIERAPQYQRVGIAALVPIINFKTIYVQFGDWIAYLSLIVLIIYLTKAIFGRKLPR